MSSEQEEPEEGERATGMAAVFGPTINAVLAPGRAYDAVGSRPGATGAWIVLWVLVGITALTFVNVDVQRQFMRIGFIESMQRQGQQIDAERAAQIIESIDKWAPIMGVAQNLVLALLIGVVAVMLWAGATMLGGSAKFSKAFGVAAVGSVIHPLLATAYITLNWWMDPPEIRRMADIPEAVPTLSLDLLFGNPDMSMALRTFMMRVDLFNLWWVVVIAIGCERLLRLRKGGAYGLSITIWLITAIIGALFSAMGQG